MSYPPQPPKAGDTFRPAGTATDRLTVVLIDGTGETQDGYPGYVVQSTDGRRWVLFPEPLYPETVRWCGEEIPPLAPPGPRRVP